MNGKKHKFWPQKNKKKSLLQKQEIFDIDDIYVNKILVSKEEPYGTNNAQIMRLNTLLDITIMMLLDHHV